MLEALFGKLKEDKESRKAAVILAVVLAVVAVAVIRQMQKPEMPLLSVEEDKSPEGMKAETTADSRLMFDRATVDAKAGESFVVSAMVDPGENRVSGVEIEVNYDAKKLKLEKIEPSETFSLELAKAKIDQAKGFGSIALGVPLDSPAVSETSAIANLTFRALQSTGTAMVAFTGNSIVAAHNEPGNVVKEKVPVTVTFGMGAAR